ncbi:cytochrome C oxidase subunit IV family protein [Mycobacterium bourgelatii]|uniref:cytochrome C oxidase subunit IV family protein n=1 Tax=Mycobacterium bourgelatii TaxID=1273442 RepID=UPI0013D746C7|nr:cytochrome C oxidase subunit IV family protein [Mycobacterium bourgelatii]MCV6975184.1 cytochrome C oxidase subunit IV family protein [Mycobacterium bourgelatii]
MEIRFNKRLLIAWLVLASLTLAYLWIDHSVDGSPGPSVVVTLSVIAIALIKVRIIFREFMEVRHAPAVLCRLTDAWVVLVGVSLFSCYIVGSTLG